ncbi:glutathione hydrolase 5 proenzyme isoform X2 [Choloepus didactylus]|uniref:glutathione hydrolase 5 proenzyme isoform X2 n=1 Tax=Choloepus didactylus TaxID=27675 RepID=UPI00189E8A94|nr:glutathione hydrolase 5 proenzyme isoform X2 [Choloepus didactylus]
MALGATAKSPSTWGAQTGREGVNGETSLLWKENSPLHPAAWLPSSPAEKLKAGKFGRAASSVFTAANSGRALKEGSSLTPLWPPTVRPHSCLSIWSSVFDFSACPVCLSTCKPLCPSIYKPVLVCLSSGQACLSICLSLCPPPHSPSICSSVQSSVSPSVRLVCLRLSPSFSPSVRLSTCLPSSSPGPGAMPRGHGATVGLALLGLGLAAAILVPAVLLSRHRSPCGPRSYAHAAVAADSKVCSDIGRAVLQQRGTPVDAAIAALVCTSVVNPQSTGLGGGVIFTIYNATTGKVETINARETVPSSHVPGLLDQCEKAQPLGTGAQWIGVPGELRGYAVAHRRHGRLPWAQLFRPTIVLLRGDHRVSPTLGRLLNNSYLRPLLYASSLQQLFFNATEPLRPQDPLPWPALATTLETVAAEGAEALYTGRLARMLVEDIAKQGSRLTLQDLAAFRPEVGGALEVPLGGYTLYSPPPPAGGPILSFILNVLKGFNFSAESVARPEGRVDVYHRLVETLKFAGGQRWRLWDPRSHLEAQNASQELLGEALARHVRQQIDARGDHPLSHYRLAGAWGHRTGTAHVSVIGEDGSAVAATSTINTPFGAMVYSPQTGLLLNNELLDLCWRSPQGSGVTPPPGERPPSSMAPSILLNAAQGSKLVIGGAGGELIIPAMAQAIMNKLWLGFDLRTAIEAPILHVNSKGHVEYEPNFSQEAQKGLQARGQSRETRPYFLNVVQAVSQEGACVDAVSDPRKGGEAAGY